MHFTDTNGKLFKQGLKTKSMGVFKVRRIVLDSIGVDSILFYPVVPEIFYFKHDVGASNVINFNNFFGNSNVDSLKAGSHRTRQRLRHRSVSVQRSTVIWR